MIILEGPDGSGKSSLAAKLGGIFSCSIEHAGGPPDSEPDLRGRIIKQIGSYGSILDRSNILSEIVYGTIIRGKTLIPRNELQELFREFFIRRLWTVIYCRPNDEVLREYISWKMIEETNKKPHKSIEYAATVISNYWEIIDMYDRLMNDIKREGALVLNYVWHSNIHRP